MRIPLIAGNWKLFKSVSEAKQFVEELKQLVRDAEGVEIVVAPVFTAISAAAEAASGSVIKIAAQDCYWEQEGAYTGEVSPRLLKEAGCSYVIIGHSERRQYFGETDETVNLKVKAALASGLAVLLCVGESLVERESGAAFRVIETQLRNGLAEILQESLQQVVIAYEPVWAIGTGKTATDGQAQEVHAFIRTLLAETYSQTAAEAVRIIYGGSVKPENIRGLMAQQDIDGALVGGASLKAESFSQIALFQG